MLITCGCSKNLAELKIKDNLNFIYGEDIYYDANKGIITAKNINAKLKVENTNKGKK